MARSKHAVATVVMDNSAVGRDDPRATCGKGDVGVHRSRIVEIHEPILEFGDKVVSFEPT